MSRIVVLGERSRVAGFALTGVEVVVADDDSSAVAAWNGLGPDVAVLVLTPGAAEALTDVLSRERPTPGRPLPVVMPEVTW